MGNFGDSFTGAAGALLERLAAHLPSLIGALVLLAVGWLLARLLRILAVRGMQLAESLIERLAGPSRLRVGRSANVLGTPGETLAGMLALGCWDALSGGAEAMVTLLPKVRQVGARPDER